MSESKRSFLLGSFVIAAVLVFSSGFSQNALPFAVASSAFFLLGSLCKTDSQRLLIIALIALSLLLPTGLFSSQSPTTFSEFPYRFYRYWVLEEAFSSGKIQQFPQPFVQYSGENTEGILPLGIFAFLSQAIGILESWKLLVFISILALALGVFGISGGGRAGYFSSCAFLLFQPHHQFINGNIHLYFASALFLLGFFIWKERLGRGFLYALIMTGVYFSHQGFFFSACAFIFLYSLFSGKRNWLAKFSLSVFPAIVFGIMALGSLIWAERGVLSVFTSISSRGLGAPLDFSRFHYELFFVAPCLVLVGICGFLFFKGNEGLRIFLSAAVVVSISLLSEYFSGKFYPFFRIAFGHFVSVIAIIFLAVFSGKLLEKANQYLLTISVALVLLGTYGAFLGEPAYFSGTFGYGLSRHGNFSNLPLLSGRLGAPEGEILLWERENPCGFARRAKISMHSEFSGGWLNGLFPYYSEGEYSGNNFNIVNFSLIGDESRIDETLGVVREIGGAHQPDGTDYSKLIAQFGSISVAEKEIPESAHPCSFSKSRAVGGYATGICNSSIGDFPQIGREGNVVVNINGEKVDSWQSPEGRTEFLVTPGESFELSFSDKVYSWKPVYYAAVALSALFPLAVFFALSVVFGKRSAL